MTGGLQDQLTDGENWYGVGLEPSSKAIIGSQPVPYIYEDRLSKDDFVNAMVKMYEMSPEDRSALGAKGRSRAETEFSLETYVARWDELFTSIHETKGSWDTRTGYVPYEVRTL